ncbi:MAG: rod shape-determining protein MreC [Methylococcaceae bacterium TMED69]|nr:MAG: rod shape-determining protein MreC [Methylococcaceae bacterium TMED69]
MCFYEVAKISGLGKVKQNITPRLVVCAVISFLCISVDRQSNYLNPVRETLSFVVYPIQLAVDLQIGLIETISSYLKTQKTLINDMEKLRTENLQLSVRAQRYSAVKRENSRLRDLLDFPVVPNQRTIVANILSIDTKSGSQQIVVNKGENTGAQVGQAMVDVHGVIGQVIKVGPYSSTGLLITDPKHSIPVELNRTGLRALVTGIDESKKLSLSFVPIDADVVTGDLVVSSGLGNRFPSGYPVGTIKSVARVKGESFADISVEPISDLTFSREVLLVGSPSQNQGAE